MFVSDDWAFSHSVCGTPCQLDDYRYGHDHSYDDDLAFGYDYFGHVYFDTDFVAVLDYITWFTSTSTSTGVYLLRCADCGVRQRLGGSFAHSTIFSARTGTSRHGVPTATATASTTLTAAATVTATRRGGNNRSVSDTECNNYRDSDRCA